MCLCMHTCLYVCAFGYMHVCWGYVSTCMYTCICMHVFVSMYMSVPCVCMCVYTHVLVCLHVLEQSREAFLTLFALLLACGCTALLRGCLSLFTWAAKSIHSQRADSQFSASSRVRSQSGMKASPPPSVPLVWLPFRWLLGRHLGLSSGPVRHSKNVAVLSGKPAQGEQLGHIPSAASSVAHQVASGF